MTFSQTVPAVVLHASFAVEAIVGTEIARDTLERWVIGGATLFVPLHFWAETANALLRGVRMPSTDAALRIERLAAVGLETADRGVPGILEAMELADRHDLTVYDALYLQLATDIEVPLATRDRALARAAAAEGLPAVETI